jgi:hypothetical protein
MEVEIKKCLGLLVLMGQIWKDSIENYWLVGPSTATPSFPQTKSRNHFEVIW